MVIIKIYKNIEIYIRYYLLRIFIYNIILYITKSFHILFIINYNHTKIIKYKLIFLN